MTRLGRGLIATALLLAGCDSAPGAAGSASANPSPGVSPTPSKQAPSKPAPARPGARDGTNYRACLGGDCEIAVSRPVTIALSDSPVEAGPMRVRAVTARSVRVEMGTPAGPALTTTIKKGCTTAFYANNAGGAAVTSCTREPEEVRGFYIRQLVTVTAITGGTAILRLTSG